MPPTAWYCSSAEEEMRRGRGKKKMRERGEREEGRREV
jgi:predicted transposase YdaD